MKRIIFQSSLAAGLLIALMFAAAPATAQKPSWDEDGRKGDVRREDRRDQSKNWNPDSRHKPGTEQRPSWNGDRSHADRRDQPKNWNPESRHRQEYRHQNAPRRDRYDDGHRDRHGDRHERFFADRDRSHIDRYYANQYRRGKCPPGLAKKGYGCVPRGHAKRWVMYRPIPRDVIFYDLPPDVLVYLGPPPPYHRFVRVAQDILLIATGTGMVVDAIEDLGRIY